MFKKILYTACIGLALSACSEDTMDNINRDEANPGASIVDAKFQVTDGIMATAYTGWGGAYAWYVSSYTEQTFGTGNNQAMKAELRNRVETAASTTFNNEWNGVYANLENIRQMLEKTEEGGLNAGQNDIRGIAQVLWVLNFELLTDMHGDIPYSEALLNAQPKLDAQESIYSDFMVRIDEAISLLSSAAANKENHCGAQDLLYGGDASKWLAFAHAVKARLLLNASYRDSSNLSKAKSEAQEALSLGFNGAQLSVFNGVDCDNSWAAYNWSRYYIGANKTVADLMADREDPRLDIYAWDVFGSGVDCAPAGDAELAKMTETVGLPMWLENGAATLHIFSISECQFIIAECQARAGEDASAAFAAGIEASFADMADAAGEDIGDASEYIASLGEVTLDEVMVQKYLSQCRDEPIQSYNDIRRCKALGKEFITLNNPNNTLSGQNQWPLRLPYGNSDVISNPNVAEAFGSGNSAGNYLFTENIWLFGGSR